MEGPGKLMDKRAMHKKGGQKYDIWLGEIKCKNVKCEMSLGSTFHIANHRLFHMGGYQGQNSVLLFCCAVLLFCYEFMMFWHSVLKFFVLLFGPNVQLFNSVLLFYHSVSQITFTFLLN